MWKGWVVDPNYSVPKVFIRRILANRQLINDAKSLIESSSNMTCTRLCARCIQWQEITCHCIEAIAEIWLVFS